MALGDGIRRDISKVSRDERDRFIAAILKLDTKAFSFPDGVTYWDKQEDIHKNAHFAGVDVHRGPAFIPWHRVLVNRLEELLRKVDSALSLHYWDWTTDPRVGNGDRKAILGAHGFMGSDNGNAGKPFLDFESSEKEDIANGGDGIHDHIWRQVAPGAPPVASDDNIINNPDFASFNYALQKAHNNAHGYIGGTIGTSGPGLIAAHFSFHDPFVFLLHSNMDRLWAKWQTNPAYPERKKPDTAYSGLSDGLPSFLSTTHVEPWAGGTGLEPWASDPTERGVITYTDLSVVTPPRYDTMLCYPIFVRRTLVAKGISIPVSIHGLARGVPLVPPISIRELMQRLA